MSMFVMQNIMTTRIKPKVTQKACRRKAIKNTMHRFKHDKLVFARSKANPRGQKVNDRGQALAISFSYAKKQCAVKKKAVTKKN